jgi:hypothetical protein
MSKCDCEFTLAKSVLSICFSVLNTDLASVNGEQVRVEHMFFGAQHGLDGVKSVLSTCFFEAEHGRLASVNHTQIEKHLLITDLSGCKCKYRSVNSQLQIPQSRGSTPVTLSV